jgi:cytidylate kinase
MTPPADAGARPAPPLIVAIDGPAGAGKSTVARRLAAALGVPFVDTGAMYRAAAVHLAEEGVDLDDRAAVAAAVPRLPLELTLAAGRAEVRLAGAPVEDRIRSPQVGALTSRAALHPELRARLVELQREFVRRHGGVMEGRDIGTVVVPETPFKFYLDAATATRAERRHAELRARGLDAELGEIARQIRERDERDSGRESSPLVAADDALRISSDGLSAQEVADRLRAEIERRRSVR